MLGVEQILGALLQSFPRAKEHVRGPDRSWAMIVAQTMSLIIGSARLSLQTRDIIAGVPGTVAPRYCPRRDSAEAVSGRAFATSAHSVKHLTQGHHRPAVGGGHQHRSVGGTHDDPIGLDFRAFDWQGTNRTVLASVDRFSRG